MKIALKFLVFMFVIPQIAFCSDFGSSKKEDEFAGLTADAAGNAAAPSPRPEYQAHEANQTIALTAKDFDLSKASNEASLYKLTKEYFTQQIEAEIAKLSTQHPDNVKRIIDVRAKAFKDSKDHFDPFQKAYSTLVQPGDAKGIYDSQIQEVSDTLYNKYKISEGCVIT